MDSTKKWAQFYRAKGLNPLPSRMDKKAPFCKFADLWEKDAPIDLFDKYETTNIQVMTGRHWNLLVIDVDGLEAMKQWEKISKNRLPNTWQTHSGDEGFHIWFKLSKPFLLRLPKIFLWKNGKESIERLCDQSLIFCPPSIHPITKRKYRFSDKYHSPAMLPQPAKCPDWILDLKGIGQEFSMKKFIQPSVKIEGRVDVLSLIKSWGVRVVGPTRQNGWIPCRSIDREDIHDSAAVHSESGYYVDHAGQRLNLIELGIKLGIFHDFREGMRIIHGS